MKTKKRPQIPQIDTDCIFYKKNIQKCGLGDNDCVPGCKSRKTLDEMTEGERTAFKKLLKTHNKLLKLRG